MIGRCGGIFADVQLAGNVHETYRRDEQHADPAAVVGIARHLRLLAACRPPVVNQVYLTAVREFYESDLQAGGPSLRLRRVPTHRESGGWLPLRQRAPGVARATCSDFGDGAANARLELDVLGVFGAGVAFERPPARHALGEQLKGRGGRQRHYDTVLDRRRFLHRVLFHGVFLHFDRRDSCFGALFVATMEYRAIAFLHMASISSRTHASASGWSA